MKLKNEKGNVVVERLATISIPTAATVTPPSLRTRRPSTSWRRSVLSQLLQLRKEHFHLYQPLRMLLQLDLDDLLALQDALPRLQPVQMLQLLALLQLQPFDVLELKRILQESRLTSNHDSLVEDLGSLLPPPTSATAGPTGTAAAAGLPALPQAQQPQPLGLGGVGLAVAGAPPTPHATPAPPVPHAPR